MPIWTDNKPPSYKKDAVATERGWEDPVTGEILVAIRGLAEKAAEADVDASFFVADSLIQGTALAVKVRFNERVDVTAGLSILVASTGLLGPIQLFADAQTNVQDVLFDKQADLVTAAVVPAEAATLSIAAQSIVLGAGTIVDDLGAKPASHLVISAEAAAVAGSKVIA